MKKTEVTKLLKAYAELIQSSYTNHFFDDAVEKSIDEFIKTNKIMTQRTKLESEIKDLQEMLMQKAMVSDAFTIIGIFKELEIKKSILLNLD